MAPAPPRSGEEDADRALLASVQDTLSQAERTLEGRLDHGRGCPRCCYGPFPVNVLDARRLRRGLAALAERDPEGARDIVARARDQAGRYLPAFPGEEGRLGDDDDAVASFCADFAAEPCPALGASGRCELYDSRPLVCRTFGPPVRLGAQVLPGCDWCFSGSAAEREEPACIVDPEGREDAILTRLEAEGPTGDTVIAFVLAEDP